MNTQVNSAGRVLDVLEFIASQNKPMLLRDITNELAIPKSSAPMLFSTLSSQGYLTGSATSGFTARQWAPLLLCYSDPATVNEYLDSVELEPLTSKTITCKKAIMRRLRQVTGRGVPSSTI